MKNSTGADQRQQNPVDEMSPADVAAHEAASYVRRPVARPLPVESGARRRVLNVRGW